MASQAGQDHPNKESALKTIAVNRKALHDYHILESHEAGIALTGTEVKSIREGRANLREAYARPTDGELWLYGCHIAPYTRGGPHNHDPIRPRKLLLHREELDELIGKVGQKGFTIVPLRLYLKRGLVKVQIGLAKGRKQYEKREVLVQREVEREIRRELKATRRP
ncbi:MAG: SsrA-binding protein SmpB [Chloroflexi bacterium]|nr:SsrA-binding protein SmpB [Chloroflexota bacterium]